MKAIDTDKIFCGDKDLNIGILPLFQISFFFSSMRYHMTDAFLKIPAQDLWENEVLSVMH